MPLIIDGGLWLSVILSPSSERQMGKKECGHTHRFGGSIYSYIWQHLEIGYVQGMCDLLAPLLVILDDGKSTLWLRAVSSLSELYTRSLLYYPHINSKVQETLFTHLLLPTSFSFRLVEAMAFSCFTELMKRMNQNFPHGGAMDTHFANMRSLIQVTQAPPVLITCTRSSFCTVK